MRTGYQNPTHLRRCSVWTGWQTSAGPSKLLLRCMACCLHTNAPQADLQKRSSTAASSRRSPPGAVANAMRPCLHLAQAYTPADGSQWPSGSPHGRPAASSPQSDTSAGAFFAAHSHQPAHSAASGHSRGTTSAPDRLQPVLQRQQRAEEGSRQPPGSSAQSSPSQGPLPRAASSVSPGSSRPSAAGPAAMPEPHSRQAPDGAPRSGSSSPASTAFASPVRFPPALPC